MKTSFAVLFTVAGLLAQDAGGTYQDHSRQGAALDLKGEYTEARKHLSKALELAPAAAKPQAFRAMAMSYVFEGKAKEAEHFERRAFELQIAAGQYILAAEVANECARVLLELGDSAGALRWYGIGNETAQKKTDMTAAEKDLWAFRWEHAQARVAARQGKAAEAKKHAATAKAIFDKGTNPEQARFVPYLTGYVAFYTGDNAQAIADLQKVEPADPFILSLLAQAYEKAGQGAKAKELYQKIMESNAHNPTNAFARPLAKRKL